jgi:hypothetical protein
MNSILLKYIDALKTKLDRLRPLPPELVDNLREVYDIRLTYHSNAIAKGRSSTNEGNTLTQSETQIGVATQYVRNYARSTPKVHSLV